MSTDSGYRHVDGNIVYIERPSQLTCAVCLELFPLRNQLITHVFSHCAQLLAPSDTWEHCSPVFSDKLMLHTHSDNRILTKGPLLELTCASCARVFTSQYLLMRHVFLHVSAVLCPSYICWYCCEVFKHANTLQLHICNGSTALFRPMSSQLRFTDMPQITYNTSLQQHTSQKLIGNGQMGASYLSNCQIIVRKLFLDKELTKLVSPSSNLKKHSKIFLGKWEVFNVSFKPSIQLKTHKTLNSRRKPFQCNVCGKSFTHSVGPREHRRLHSGERPFACEACGKSFTHYSSFRRHKSIHSEVRPFVCEICGKTFALSLSMRVHKRIHSGERPFTCDVCGKSFAKSGGLKGHRIIHSTERPFACEECGKSFKWPLYLKVHKRIHSGERPFACQVCGKAFSFSSGLNIHRRIHLVKV